jgi:hypothetical protein
MNSMTMAASVPMGNGDWKVISGDGSATKVYSQLTGAESVVLEKAGTSSLVQMQTGLSFQLAGSPPQQFTNTWSQTFSAQNIGYFKIKYIAQGVYRTYSKYGVVKVLGQVDGNTVELNLVECQQVINDGLEHVLFGRISPAMNVTEVRIQITTKNTLAKIDFSEISFYDTEPADIGGFQYQSIASPPQGFTCLNIDNLCNDSYTAEIGRIQDSRKILVDCTKSLTGPYISVANVPFRIGSNSSSNLIHPSAVPADRMVQFLKQPVSRRYFFPSTRNDKNSIPINAAVSEVYFILISDEPVSVSRYALPDAPYRLIDAEEFYIELKYSNGRIDKAFPYSVQDEGCVVQRHMGVYCVPADNTLTLNEVIFHNRSRLDGVDHSILSVTANTGSRLIPAIATDAPTVTPIDAVEPAYRIPFMQQVSNGLVCGNRYYDLSIDLNNRFAITQVANRWSPTCAVTVSNLSGFEVINGSTTITGNDCNVVSCNVFGSTAYVTLQSRIGAIPLRFLLTLTVDETAEFKMGLNVTNISTSETLKPAIKFPILKNLQQGLLADTSLFYPKYRNTITTEECYFQTLNDSSFPFQFYDIYNYSMNCGLSVRTDNRGGAPLEYVLAKNQQGVTAAILYGSEFYSLSPGQNRTYVTTAIGFHKGKWQEALTFYRNSLNQWYVPTRASNRQWFDDIFLLRNEFLNEEQSQRISHTHALYDSNSQFFNWDDILKTDKEYWAIEPDVIHFSDWFYNSPGLAGELDSWGDYHYSSVGGLSVFAAALADLQNNKGIPFSLYLIPDRYSKKSPIGLAEGDKYAGYGPEGNKYEDSTCWSVCIENAEWRTFISDAYQRVQSETQSKMMYLDVFPYRKGHACYAQNHGHSVPTWCNRSAATLLQQIRQKLPSGTALWCENPPADYVSQYLDGNINYYYLDLHEHFIESYDMSEKAEIYSEPFVSLYRFVLPQIKQFAFPVGNERNVNSAKNLKFIVFNAESLYDTTWFLFQDTDMEMMRKYISIVRQYKDCFTSWDAQMLVATERSDVFANKFAGNSKDLWMLYNSRNQTVRGEVLKVPHSPAYSYFDLWNKKPLTPRVVDGMAYISVELGPQGLGCVVQVRSNKADIDGSGVVDFGDLSEFAANWLK